VQRAELQWCLPLAVVATGTFSCHHLARDRRLATRRFALLACCAVQVKQRVRSQTPSIQGPWTHEVQEALKAQQ